MKLLIICGSLCLMALTGFAGTLTSTMSGIIDYLPVQGQIIKKGEPLVRYSESEIKIQQEINEVKIEIAKAGLKDLETDFNRCKMLHAKSAVSLAAYEDIVYKYLKGKCELEKLQLEHKDLSRLHQQCRLNAPFDCKVTRLYVIQNSGIRQGGKILEVETNPANRTPANLKIARN